MQTQVPFFKFSKTITQMLFSNTITSFIGSFLSTSEVIMFTIPQSLEVKH